jgi:hypothetical protein
MPADLLAGRYPIDKGLESIETLSKEAEVSLEAADNRIVELSQEPAVFMVFEFGHKPGHRVAGPGEAREALGVHLQQISRAGHSKRRTASLGAVGRRERPRRSRQRETVE